MRLLVLFLIAFFILTLGVEFLEGSSVFNNAVMYNAGLIVGTIYGATLK